MMNRSDPWITFPLSGLKPEEIMGVEVYRYIGEVPQSLRNQAHVVKDRRETRRVRSADGRSPDPTTDPTVVTRWYIEETCGVVVFRTKAAW